MNRKILLGAIAGVSVLLAACSCVCPVDDAANIEAGTAADFATNVRDKVYFNFNEAKLSPDAEKIVEQQAEWLKKHSGVAVTIEGHADVRGTEDYNKALGLRRANAVKDLLVKLGVSADRITVVSYGKERPFSQGATEKDHALNRRTVTVVAG
ncbi:MAG: peptidoglycan-associated lipoprotein Pal [Holosporales bacterium]|nr:peptidoglycan-associated lipoprotein Pal [Holosporales bacterium]